jgi:multidrug efflux pump subunit AcrA (membrane-fusion protein)
MRIPSATLAFPLLLALAGCGGRDTAARSFPGTIELDESDAAPLVGGRVLTVRVTEGDTVRMGDTLAVLTQSQIPANLEDRRARLAAAESRLAPGPRRSSPRSRRTPTGPHAISPARHNSPVTP